jgi:hypothetical protein
VNLPVESTFDFLQMSTFDFYGTGENSHHNLLHIADFRLKCCILKEDSKNKISGRKRGDRGCE